MRRWLLGMLCALVGCTSGGDDASGGASGPATNTGSEPPSPPAQPPPTGGRWSGVPVEDACGRTTIAWTVVDEVCGDVGSAAYLDAFEAPMFRDGTVLAGLMYAVDASALWVIDSSDPARLERRALSTGFGRPLAAAQHAGRVLLASADAGLLVLSVADPLAPTISARVPIEGIAHDVHVDADRAYIAAGSGGLVVVDLAVDPPAVIQAIEIPGYAAGVVTRGELALVAACDTLAAVDLASGTITGQTWINGAYDGGVLVAPAKDVELVGDVAFVAAGRYGAVAVDVSDTSAPSVLGSCTLETDLAFYASGVRADAGALYVAGGEWGVLKVDAEDPAAACSMLVLPAYPPPPSNTGSCTEDPPWEVMDWQDRWTPTPPPPPPPAMPDPARDPIQVLPTPGVVFAFGDARRIGLRAVDARDPVDPFTTKIGRYEEPWLVEDVAAAAGRLLVAGRAGAVFDVAADGTLTPVDVPAARGSTAGTLLGDGRWVLVTGDGQLAVEGAEPTSLSDAVWPRSLAVVGEQILVPTATRLSVFDATGAAIGERRYGKPAYLPPSVAVVGSDVVVAAPEWTAAAQVSEASVTELPAQGVFDANDILNASLWQIGIPRRVLVSAGDSVVEVSSLGDRAGLRDHATGQQIALPAGIYSGGAFADGRVHLAVYDRNRYRSQIVSVALATGGPELVGIESFTGVATDVAADAGRLFVGDADGAVRIYDVGMDGALSLRRVQRLEAAP
jgi:hypothetical protein